MRGIEAMEAHARAQDLVDLYCAAWSTPDAARRAQLLDEALTADARYTDPTVDAASAQELLAHIARVQAQRPGSRVARTSTLDLHHGLGRFLWHAVGADGLVLREGVDFVEFSDDSSRIVRLVGFFGDAQRR